MSDSPPAPEVIALSVSGLFVSFHCPGCKSLHGIPIAGPEAWEWNGDKVKPTITPSILVMGTRFKADHPGDLAQEDARCHSFIRDGQIQFLADCAHPLAGQTVPLAPTRTP